MKPKISVELIAKLAEAMGLADDETRYAYTRIHDVLSRDFGAVDSGIGLGGMDFWIRVGGREYLVIVKPKKEDGPPPS